MAVSTVKLNGTTLMTVNDTTAVAEDVAQSKYFYGADGVKTVGTASGATKKYTATIKSTGSSSSAYVQYDGTKYYTKDQTFEFSAGESLYMLADGRDHGEIKIDGVTVKTGYPATYTYTLPECDIDVALGFSMTGYASVTSIPNSILIEQNGTYDVKDYDFANVNVATSGGGSVSVPVKFIDYDGTILHSYSVADFMALTALPANPSHSGLTAQGWNWSLADAKAQLTAYPEAGLTIGQMYITDDGKTRIYVHFEGARKSPYLGICPKGTVSIDWGDNSATDTLTGTSLALVQTVQHEFPSAGDYVITLTVESGSFSFYGVSNTSHILKKSTATTANISKVYTNAVQKIELGTGATIGNYAFNYCMSLETITIPSSVTNIGTNAFYYCYSLMSLTVPNGITSIGQGMCSDCRSIRSVSVPSSVTNIANGAFYNCHSLASFTFPSSATSTLYTVFYSCYSLESLTIPDSVTSIQYNAFYNCYSLASVTIPNAVTSIEANAFYYCYSLASVTIPNVVTSIEGNAFRDCHGVKEYHFLPTTPPTLAATTAFSNIQSDCIIYVPQGCLEAYQTATNWSTYASYMQEEPT